MNAGRILLPIVFCVGCSRHAAPHADGGASRVFLPAEDASRGAASTAANNPFDASPEQNDRQPARGDDGGDAAVVAAPWPAKIAGTYEFELCAGSRPCRTDNTRIYARGVIVLWSRPLAGRSAPEEDTANACFRFTQLVENPYSFAGRIVVASYALWRRSTQNVLELELFKSPDAAYKVWLTPMPNAEWKGYGESMGPYPDSPTHRDDEVLMRRVGPPSPACKLK